MYCLIFKFSACPWLSKEKKQLFGYKSVTSQRNNVMYVLGCGLLRAVLHQAIPTDVLRIPAQVPSPQSNSSFYSVGLAWRFPQITLSDLHSQPLRLRQCWEGNGLKWIWPRGGSVLSARLEQQFYSAWQTHPLLDVNQGNPQKPTEQKVLVGLWPKQSWLVMQPRGPHVSLGCPGLLLTCCCRCPKADLIP